LSSIAAMTEQMGRLAVILSTERSGSTLLATMLGGNRHVVAPPEMHLFRYGDFDTWRRAKPSAIASLSWLMRQLGEPSDPSHLVSRFAGRQPESVYRELLRIGGTGQWLLDKTPAYARDPNVLKRIEGLQPIYVWLVRHPLGVLASSLERRRQRQLERRAKAATRLGRAAVCLTMAGDRLCHLHGPYQRRKLRYWRDMHTRIEAFLAAVPEQRWLRVHFEELVRAPLAELERLCTALDLDLEPQMLQPRRNAPSALAWGLGNEKVLSHRTIDPSVAHRWRERFDEQVLDKRTRAVMGRLGCGA
jgi:LPS sulfotransferase NodH